MGAQTGGQSQHQGCFPEEAAAWRLEQEEGRKASPGLEGCSAEAPAPLPGAGRRSCSLRGKEQPAVIYNLLFRLCISAHFLSWK